MNRIVALAASCLVALCAACNADSIPPAKSSSPVSSVPRRAPQALSAQDQAVFDALASELDHIGNLPVIEAELQRLLAQNPDNPDILVQLVRVQLNYATGSLPMTLGQPQQVVDGPRMGMAQALVDQAIQLDERNALAWLYSGRILYLRKRYDQALQKFERARTLDPDNARVYLNLGEVLWAQAQVQEHSPGDPQRDRRTIYGPAIAAFERGLQARGSAAVKTSLAMDLGALYVALDDLGRADAAFTAAVEAGGEGWSLANALHVRAQHRLERMGDVDAALRDIEQGRKVVDFGLLARLHATALLVKAGQGCAPKCSKEAKALIRQALPLIDDSWEFMRMVSMTPTLLPAVNTFREAGLVEEWSDPRLSRMLAMSVYSAPPEAIAHLLDLGIDPDPVVEEHGGNALHRAILARKFEIVTLLLDRGADPTVTYGDGVTPLRLLEAGGSPPMVALARRLRADPAVMATLPPQATSSIEGKSLAGSKD